MMRFFPLLIIGLALSASTAYAITDSFVVRTLVGDDTTPPSIPTGLTATPIATSQIDLTWTSSADDYILSGYHVYRDDVHIATTTDPLYSDIGLYASSTYAYYVVAFDSFFNFSASSSVVFGTTPATSTPTSTTPTSTPPQQGSITRLSDLESLEIIPTAYGAIVRYETRGYVRSVLRWGKTISYELGSSVERAFARTHEIFIEGLAPDSLYKLRIEGENQAGVQGVLTETSFRTLPLTDTLPPGNVGNLAAVRRGEDVLLTWENPRDTDFDHVRVVRSTTFYPTTPYEGWVVYEGKGIAATDQDVWEDETRFYYTVFAYDAKGNISSGAVTSIGDRTKEVGTTTNPLEISFDTLDFYQDNILLSPTSPTTLYINGGQHLTIAIPYEELPEHLKTIVVTLTPEARPDTSFSFLLRVNAEKTAYTARLAPLGVAGIFNIQVSVFDFKTAQLGYAEGYLISSISTYAEDDTTAGVSSGFIEFITRFLRTSYLIAFILLLVALAILSRRLMRARW